MNSYRKPTRTTDLREAGRIILAHGEVTGHCHAVEAEADTDLMPAAQYFEEPEGRRVLLAWTPCSLRHPEHRPIRLDPGQGAQARQGDVFLDPIGTGAWEVIRQREYHPEELRQVLD